MKMHAVFVYFNGTRGALLKIGTGITGNETMDGARPIRGGRNTHRCARIAHRSSVKVGQSMPITAFVVAV
ncbi:MAG: hypothetical protein KatS3mg111_1162 [Pirellulaceae bacterium]|nr:MAG: hypothetical protein KatS3mg111_1162 [Pirellulaceae bacterium]